MELAHVDLDERVVVAEQEVGQRLGQLGLTDTGRAGEDERARRPLGVLQPGAGAADRLGDRLDGVLLADDPLVQLVLHAQQARGLGLGQLEHRDAGPVAQHLGDLLVVHLGDHVEVAGAPLLFALGALRDELLLPVAQAGGLLEVLGVYRRFLLPARLGDLLVELAQVRRRGHPADPHPRPRLVDQVDRLVRQVAVVDVAVRQRRGRDHRRVGDGHPVVRLVAVAQPLEDLDGVLHRRLTHLHRLEPTLQGGVLLDVLAVLVERGGADGLQLAAGQLRLEDAGRVDRALGGTRTDQRVQLVDEQDDVAAGVDLLEHLLQALLEVTAVARARHQRTQVQGVELLVLQRLGHLAVHDGLRQALDDGRLADAGLADQHRVVLGAPAQHLHHPLDFLLAADDRVQLALHRGGGQVAAELVEHQRRGRAAGLAAAPTGAGLGGLLALVAGEQLDHLLAHPGQLGAQLDQHLGGHALTLADQAQQDVLGADVVVAELQRLAQAQLQHLLGARGERDVSGRRLLALADDLLDLAADALQRDAQRLQRLGRHALALVDQTQQDVLGADVVVVEHPGLFLRQDDDPAGAVGKSFKHRWLPALPHHRYKPVSGPSGNPAGPLWPESRTCHPL
ncbi:hypothetical protein PICSAR21_03545 [Mycobacterium avium subsp. paratuberculosis]|nr:hypothetical protein PICSAR21_03545 [Mycobacterium avium subsp. paratuberculosis]